MAAVVAQSSHIFGLRKGVTNNLCFLDDQTIVFPSGNNCVRYNIDQKWQKFIPGTEKSQGMQALALSANRRYLAVSERGEPPTVTVYDLTHEQGRKRKVLTAGDLPVGEFLCMAFSPDSKYLICQSGGPKWTLVFWLWEKQKVMTTISSSEGDPVNQTLDVSFRVRHGEGNYMLYASSGSMKCFECGDVGHRRAACPHRPAGGRTQTAAVAGDEAAPAVAAAPAAAVSFNPQDNTQVCVSGVGLLRLYHYGEGALKRTNAAKVEGIALLCHAWVSGARVVAGTDTGRLLMIESGELRWELDAGIRPVPPLETGQTESKRPIDTKAERNAATTTTGPSVTAILPYSKGFMCSAGPGTVCVFENTEEKDSYRKTGEILIPPDPCSNEPSRAQQQEVATLSLSPGEETLALSTQQGQLYAISLISAEISRGEQAHFEFLSSSFHSKPITGLSICIRKPLVATCSLDRSVRVWNYDTNVLELYKEFQEEALSVSLHPSGLFLLVGFTDKLRMMNLLIDDIRTFKEFTVRGCRECVFSHGGHLFAAINGNVIHIYSVTTFDNILTLKGHNGKVQAVAWSADDGRLVSCGADGAVYEWNVFSGKRESESVLKSCVYTGVAVSSDARTIFAAGTSLKEIQDCQASVCARVLREVPGDDVTYTALAVSRSGKVIFTGTSSGTLRVIKYPLPLQKDWIEYQAHCGPVTKVLVTFDDQLLLTASGDGSLLVWRIVDKEGRGLRDKEVHYTEEILVTKTDLEEKNQNMQELKTRVEELQMEKEYQLRLCDISYNDKIKELSETFIREIESLKTENQVMKREGEKQSVAHQDALMEITEKHSKELQDSECSNSQKLLLEYAKSAELQQQKQAMEEEYERRLGAAEQSGARALEELTLSFQAKLHDKTQQLGQCQDEARQQRREFEEDKRQTEEDADQEIQGLRLRYEKRLYGEKETNLTLRGETGIMKKQLGSLQRELEERCGDIERLKKEATRLHGVIRSLEKDILGLKKVIAERVETIRDKEKVIGEQTKKNQELEKLKYSQNYTLEELKKNIAPRDHAIAGMKEQIQEMEAELEHFHQKNTQLELRVDDLKLKLRATGQERNMEMQRVKQSEATVRRFKVDLHRCAALLQEPKQLKAAVQEMYGCYVRPSDGVNLIETQGLIYKRDQTSSVEIAGVDADIQREHVRQQDHLEKTVGSLKTQLAKDSELQRQKNVKLMRENVSLIQEINKLRQELRTARAQIHDHHIRTAVAARNKPNRRSPDEHRAVAGTSPDTEITRRPSIT
ncbi:Cilia- and flagella-associated protein 57 [Merluccius polli]|uniref:Cilia- and flagella-associated protein 57 n=1 Tax=Merluccius polli TaxID=89951 RepID=A0AA47M6C1_MERPO|nr:Cilia- and flagella-associated protein 57 [Merluccius polli]